MSRTSATVSSFALGALIAFAMASADAQDEQRRRPGAKAPRPTAPAEQPAEAPKKKEAAKETPPPEAEGPKRRRPGEATEAAKAPSPPPPATPATPTTEAT